MTKYEAVGTGIEEMATAQNYETNTVKDVLGMSRTRATKGNKTISVSPIAINPTSSEFAKFVDMAIERGYELSQLVKKFLFVKMYKRVGESESAAMPVAWTQDAVVVPQNWAMGNQELQGEVELNLVGEPIYGTVDFTAVGEKFNPETAPPTASQIFYDEGDALRSSFIMYYIYDDADV